MSRYSKSHCCPVNCWKHEIAIVVRDRMPHGRGIRAYMDVFMAGLWRLLPIHVSGVNFILGLIGPGLISLSACVSNNSKFIPAQPHADKGSVIYIYRPNSFSNVMITPGVIIDGKERFLIGNDKYTYVPVLPGKHSIKLNLDERYQGNFEFLLNATPGQIYFLRVNTSMKFVQGQSYIRSFNLNQVTGEIGLDEVKECKYMKPEMPSKYWLEKSWSGQESRFTTEKTSDPFSRNK